MSEPRFVIHELTGFEIPTRHERYSGHPKTSYYIMDSLYNYEVIRTYERRHRKAHTTLARLRARAEKECARLNGWWEWELQRG